MQVPVVEVRDVNLQRVGAIAASELVFSATARRNSVGEWKIELPADHPLAIELSKPGAGIVTQVNGETFSGPMETVEHIESAEHPDGLVTITGVTDDVRLSDRRCLPDPLQPDINKASKDADVREGPAESLMHQFVNVNLGPGALAFRRDPLVVMGSNAGRGAVITKSASFDQLGVLLQDIAATNALNFRLRQDGSKLRFETWPVQDRSREVRFDLLNRTLASQSTSVAAPTATHVYVGGRGEGQYRWMYEQQSTDAASLAWGRRIETFADSSSTEDNEVLGQVAAEQLEAGAQVVSSKLVPMEDTIWVMGRDWSMGDRVTVVSAGVERAEVVSGWRLIADSRGVQLGAILGEDLDSALTNAVMGLEERVSNIERTSSGRFTTGSVRLLEGGDVTLSSTGHPFQIGADGGWNLAADTNEIQARNNGSAAELNINVDGGPVNIGHTSAPITLRGQVKLGAQPSANDHATRKDYVDSQVSSKSSAAEAAAKSYTDSQVNKSEVPTIPGGTNLDNWTGYAKSVQRANVSATLELNYPTPWAGELECSVAGDMVFQRYTAYKDRPGHHYQRQKYAGAWSAWQRVGGHLAGRVNVGGVANEVSKTEVSFPASHFTATPACAVSPDSGRPDITQVTHLATPTGLTICGWRTSATVYVVAWIALEQQ